MIAAVLGIGGAALFLVVTILLILDMGVPLGRIETQPCPHCGADGRILGTKGTTRWWYCQTCNGRPWSDAETPRQAVGA